jgi:hypothetical protein
MRSRTDRPSAATSSVLSDLEAAIHGSNRGMAAAGSFSDIEK